MYTSQDDIRAMHAEAGRLYSQAAQTSNLFTMLTSSICLLAYSLSDTPFAPALLALLALAAILIMPRCIADGIKAGRLRRQARRAHANNWRQSAIDHRAKHLASNA